MQQIDYKVIKLVIWDLDDTFWKGTLSEGGIEPVPRNIELVKLLTGNGVVNSICSKNDEAPVDDKLRELDVADLFVFKSVDWTPKGPRISALIKDMGLRPVNVLFLDDNIVNLNEAKHYASDLMIAGPDAIDGMWEYFFKQEPKDLEYKRLNNYKVLEEKQRTRNEYGDNESFLYASNTEVSICNDCHAELSRIHELILRTNQLNYTKLRSSREELRALLSDADVKAGYVKVRDNFGDYGIVGFYAIKDNKCVHFLFSCRTIGQGVEQYVYATLGYPELIVEGKVINDVTKDPAPAWINQRDKKTVSIQKKSLGKIVFKGPCDLQGLTSYLDTDDTINELTYISPTRHNNIEHQGCMVNYIQIPDLKEEDIDYLVSSCIFNDEAMYRTSLFDEDVDIIFLSSLQEQHFGIYQHKTRGYKLAFGEWNHPLTDSQEWKGYISDAVWTSANKFTKDFLEQFRSEWIFLGRQTAEQYIENLRKFMLMVSPAAHICIFLGSEIPYKGEQSEAWKDRDLCHKEINQQIREFAKDYNNIHLIEYTSYVASAKDYTDSIDHFQRYVHYKVSLDINRIIAEVLGAPLKHAGKKKIVLNQLRDMLTSFHVVLLNIKKKIFG